MAAKMNPAAAASRAGVARWITRPSHEPGAPPVFTAELDGADSIVDGHRVTAFTADAAYQAGVARGKLQLASASGTVHGEGHFDTRRRRYGASVVVAGQTIAVASARRSSSRP